MMKPLCSPFSIIWIEVPDPVETPRKPGPRLPTQAVVRTLRAFKTRLAAKWRAQSWAGGMALPLPGHGLAAAKR